MVALLRRGSVRRGGRPSGEPVGEQIPLGANWNCRRSFGLIPCEVFRSIPPRLTATQNQEVVAAQTNSAMSCRGSAAPASGPSLAGPA